MHSNARSLGWRRGVREQWSGAFAPDESQGPLRALSDLFVPCTIGKGTWSSLNPHGAIGWAGLVCWRYSPTLS